jgi:hypothetical protein
MSTSPTPNFATTVLSEQPLTHSNYPKVRFWFRKDWINQKKEKLGVTKVNESSTTGDKGRGPMGVNVTLRYVEDEQGVVVDGFRASEMRKFARSIWNQLARAGKAPRSWGKAELDVAAHYRREMHRRFPELGLCEYDWKADQLATDNYPNWISNRLQEVPVKRESSDTSSMQTKRRRDSVGHISKKARTGTVPSVSIDDNSTHLTDGALNPTPSLPPIDSTTSASMPSSSATVPATVPTITVHAATDTSIPAAIPPPTIPTTIPTATVPTAPTITPPATIATIAISDDNNNTVSSVSREIEEENAPADSTTALTVTTQESPASIIANTHPLINLIATDENGAATLTVASSCTSSGQDGATGPRKTMPRVRISLTSHYLLSSYYIGHQSVIVGATSNSCPN